MTTRKKIREILKKGLQKMGVELVLSKIEVFASEKEEFGDYSTNLAFQLSRLLKKEPKEIALKLKKQIEEINQKEKIFERVETAGNGFLNFYLTRNYLQRQVKEILKQKSKWGSFQSKKKKIQVEFISANPTGLLHLGNGRGAFFGDVLAKILEKAGYQVEREYFIQDAREGAQIKELGRTALGQNQAYLTDYLKEKIKEIRPKLKKIKDPAQAGYLLAHQIQKDIKKFIEQDLKIKFNRWFFEESLYQTSQIKKTFQTLKSSKLVYQKEGAFWLKTSQFGDEKDRVLIRQDGSPTYLLVDIAYHFNKFQRGFDKVIDIWGADHQGHIQPLKIGLKILGIKKPVEILLTQMVHLKEEGKLIKFSKRKGQIIPLKWLIDEVGLDVARFFYLQKSLETQLEFDLGLAKEQSEKNPVFYLQYAYARMNSIVNKLKTQNSKLKATIQNSKLKTMIQNSRLELLIHPDELRLVKQLIRFPEIIEDIAQDYQVQRLPKYSLDLVASFHRFYESCRVISDNQNLTLVRLALVRATQITLKEILELMGLRAPEKM